MTIGTVLLMLAIVFTIGHAISDVVLGVKHARHPKDTTLTFVSLAFLLGHVIFTGEIVEWFSWIG